jgi:hypothetical protein
MTRCKLQEKILLFLDSLLELFVNYNKEMYKILLRYRHVVKNTLPESDLIKIVESVNVYLNSKENKYEDFSGEDVSLITAFGGGREAPGGGTEGRILETRSGSSLFLETSQKLLTSLLGWNFHVNDYFCDLDKLLNLCNAANKQIVWKWIRHICDELKL